jgi:hypothetical protein
VENHGHASQLGLEVFSELKSILARHSNLVTVSEGDMELCIEPIGPNTFSVLVRDEGREMTVAALRWHTHEGSAEQTVACAMWLLTPFYRITEIERRGAIVAGRLEKFEPPGQWALNSETGLLSSFLGWKRHLVRIAHQQNVLPGPSGFLKQFAPDALDENGFPVGSPLGRYVLAVKPQVVGTVQTPVLGQNVYCARVHLHP